MFVADYHTLPQLPDLAQAIPQTRLRRRVPAVLLAQRGRTAEDIAQALGCSLRAVKSWVAQYNRGDSAALHERPRSGRPPRLDPQEYPRLKQRLDAPPRPEDGACTSRGLDVQRVLEQEFGARMGLQTVYDLLHRLDYSSLMPRPQHEEAHPEVQASFKEIIVEPIDAIAAAHPDQEIRTSVEAEARFGQTGTIPRVWAPRGSRPRAGRQLRYTSLYVLMAVGMTTGATSALIMPRLNAEVLNLILEPRSRELPAGVHAVLIWDGAGDQTRQDLRVPSNISLILLPPYSPELNPVEHLWHYVRAHHWSNRASQDDDALESEAAQSLCTVCQDREKVKSICNAEYVRKRA